MERLPAADARSRAIVEKMRDDEARHGAMARAAGAVDLPFPVKGADARRGGRDAVRRVPRSERASPARRASPRAQRARAAPRVRAARDRVRASRIAAPSARLPAPRARDRAGVDALHHRERRAKATRRARNRPAAPGADIATHSQACEQRVEPLRAAQRVGGVDEVEQRSPAAASGARSTVRCQRAARRAASRQSTGTLSRADIALGEPHVAHRRARARPAARPAIAASPRSCASTRVPDRQRECRVSPRTRARATGAAPASAFGAPRARARAPYSASTSGSSCASAPQSRSTASIRAGCGSIRPRASSCQTRSGASSASSPDADELAHQRRGFRRHGEPEARGETRDAQHAQRILDERRRHVAQHAGARGRPAPPKGSISAPCSSRAIALIVRSRRARSSSSVTSGEAKNSKPR